MIGFVIALLAIAVLAVGFACVGDMLKTKRPLPFADPEPPRTDAARKAEADRNRIQQLIDDLAELFGL